MKLHFNCFFYIGFKLTEVCTLIFKNCISFHGGHMGYGCLALQVFSQLAFLCNKEGQNMWFNMIMQIYLFIYVDPHYLGRSYSLCGVHTKLVNELDQSVCLFVYASEIECWRAQGTNNPNCYQLHHKMEEMETRWVTWKHWLIRSTDAWILLEVLLSGYQIMTWIN